MTITIDKIAVEHLSQVVSVHMRAFPEFFLTFLGPKFLKEFYKSFTRDPSGIGFVAIDNETGQLVGAIAGSVEPAGYFKRLLIHRFWAFCFASLWAVLRKPTVIKRLFRAVFYRGQAPVGPKRALLSSIAVSPDCQKRGIGKLLVNKWVEEIKNRGAAGCFLTTDAIDNDSVNNFYKDLGWTVESTYETPEGRKMNRYIYDFANQEES
ncbi:MAG: GNAT family N-acetyltransferase [Sedimentisphaerales bacterium]|nr:GNAT family N-acetyltransferase [Sedimentisphaerales bacterium]